MKKDYAFQNIISLVFEYDKHGVKILTINDISFKEEEVQMYIEVLYIGFAVGAVVSCLFTLLRRAEFFPVIVNIISVLIVLATADLLGSRVLSILAMALIVLGVILPLTVILLEVSAAKRRVPAVKEMY